jgi:hypothetical protein
MTRTFAMLALLALAVPLSPALAAEDRPSVTVVAPDEGGGLWLSAKDQKGRLFLRYCAPAQPERCTPWAAADLSWKDRVQTEAAPRNAAGLGFLGKPE